jgi:hypothetical protein
MFATALISKQHIETIILIEPKKRNTSIFANEEENKKNY